MANYGNSFQKKDILVQMYRVCDFCETKGLFFFFFETNFLRSTSGRLLPKGRKN